MTTPKAIIRNELGLIEGLTYVFDDRGLINWKAMILPEFIYVNPDEKQRKRIEEKYSKPYAEIKPAEDKVEDDDLISSLAGLKHLLRTRGFNSMYTEIKEASEHFSAVNCLITFSANYETEMQEITYSDNGSAHIGSTAGFGQKYLVEIATNRAFARCIRNFLNINIVSKEEANEINNDVKVNESNDAQVELLEKAMKKKFLTFETLKEKMINEGVSGANELTKLSDLPKESIFEWLVRVKKYKP